MLQDYFIYLFELPSGPMRVLERGVGNIHSYSLMDSVTMQCRWPFQSTVASEREECWLSYENDLGWEILHELSILDNV